jgi:hypothetical protein
VPDRRKRNTPAWNSLVAAAEVMTSPNAAVRRSISKPEAWQSEAWRFYDGIGELRFGISWISNALSRVNLVAAMPPLGPGDEPTPIDLDDPRTTQAQRRAIEIISGIADGATGQGQMLGAFGTHLSVAGIAWLVIEPNPDDPDSDLFDSWEVYSSDELQTSQQGEIQVRTGDRSWRPLHPSAVVVKVWRKHPRYSYLPDAPTRAVLNILNEIELLTAHVQASAQSRLAGAGILAIPSEATFPPGQGPQPTDPDDNPVPEDTFVDTLIDAMTVPLTDRSSAASVVPLVVKVPGELVDKITHITFATPFDDRVMELTENAIRRLALGLDIPPEILTGTSGMNHWGAWQVAEEAITLHIEPLAETVTHALTLGYLRPALEAEGFSDDEISQVTVWYDTSDLRTRPNLGQAAVEAYDRMELSGEAMVRELGLATDDMPTDEEMKERILLSVARSLPTAAPVLLQELGVLSPELAEKLIEVRAMGSGGGDVDSDDSETRSEVGPGSDPDVVTDGPPEEDIAEPSIVSSALAAACDMMVRRALERAGQRLRNAAGKNRTGGAAVITVDDPTRLHTELDASVFTDFDSLLDGAWVFVPEIAGRYGVDETELRATLDTYTRGLIGSRQEHNYGRLAVALGG